MIHCDLAIHACSNQEVKKSISRATSEDNFNEDVLSSFKLEAWQDLDYRNTVNKSEIITDNTKTVCKYCKMILSYMNSTTSMMQHGKRHHSKKL